MFNICKPSRKELSRRVYARLLNDVAIWNDILYGMRNEHNHWAHGTSSVEEITGYRDTDSNRLARIGRYRRSRGWM